MKVLDHGCDSLEQLVISSSMLDHIGEYCRSQSDYERCGLIGGRGEHALNFYPTKNIAENPTHRFVVDPKDQLVAFKTMRQRREELLCIVHSHPNSPPEPSPTDLAMAAYPGTAYLIVGLHKPEIAFACFLYECGNFHELPMSTV